MKATLEFQMPEDAEDFDLALHGPVLHGALLGIQGYLRDRQKYGELDEVAWREVDDLRKMLAIEMEALPESLR